MLKKTIFVSLAALAVSSPSLAVEMPAGAATGFNSQATAYSSDRFNAILEGYGLNMAADAVADVPGTYAALSGGKIRFNDVYRAYTPAEYHAVFTAYGLELTPEKVSSKLGISSYAKEKGGKIVFGKSKLAFTGDELEEILGAYDLPEPEMAAPMPMTHAPVMAKDGDGDGVVDGKDECPNTPKGAAVNSKGCWAYAGDLLFDVDKAVIKADYYPKLDATKRIFAMNPELKVQVEGHADSTGPAAYNQKLSEKRAQAVVDYLVNTVGVAPNRLKAVGYGETMPAFSNDTEMGRAKNRRVEFTRMK